MIRDPSASSSKACCWHPGGSARSCVSIVKIVAGALVLIGICVAGVAVADQAPTPQADRLILVTGATGTQGGAVARELLARGYRVRGLTRNPGKPKAVALTELGVQMVPGSFDDPASLEGAMAGVHGVFAVTEWRQNGVEKEVIHGRALVDAARKSGVRHFVYTSVAGADEQTGVPHFDSKYVVEQYLAQSGLAWSVVRPVSFMDNWEWNRAEFLAGRFADTGEPDQRNQWIAAADIAFFVGEALDNPQEWNGRALDIAGDGMTLAEFTAVLSGVLDRPVEYEQISWADYEAAAGEELTVMHRWFASDGYSVDIAALRERYPNLRTAEDFLRSMEWGE